MFAQPYLVNFRQTGIIRSELCCISLTTRPPTNGSSHSCCRPELKKVWRSCIHEIFQQSRGLEFFGKVFQRAIDNLKGPVNRPRGLILGENPPGNSPQTQGSDAALLPPEVPVRLSKPGASRSAVQRLPPVPVTNTKPPHHQGTSYGKEPDFTRVLHGIGSFQNTVNQNGH